MSNPYQSNPFQVAIAGVHADKGGIVKGRSSRSTVVVFVFLLAGSLWAAPGQAAGHTVTLNSDSGSYFSPDLTQAASGDTVTFHWNSGFHSATWYGGSQGDPASFDSGQKSAPASDYPVTFLGGTLLFRCTVHSFISDSTGECNGMCGVITDDTQGPTATVDPPTSVIFTTAVALSGTANDNVAVARVKVVFSPILGAPTILDAICTGCGTTSATWSVQANNLLPGQYVVTARAYDTPNRFGQSAPITIYNAHPPF